MVKLRQGNRERGIFLIFFVFLAVYGLTLCLKEIKGERVPICTPAIGRERGKKEKILFHTLKYFQNLILLILMYGN